MYNENTVFKSRDELIDQLAEVLFDAGYVRDGFSAAVKQRESTLPTGLRLPSGINVAIPHTEASYVETTGIVFALLKSPVVFHEMVEPSQQVNVQLVMLLAVAEPQAQVKTLRKIMSLLQDESTMKQLLDKMDVSEIERILEQIFKGENNGSNETD